MPSRDVVPSCLRKTDRLINQAVISRVAIAVEKQSRRRRRKQREASTNQSNNFGVSCKRCKPSTSGLPGNNQMRPLQWEVEAGCFLEKVAGSNYFLVANCTDYYAVVQYSYWHYSNFYTNIYTSVITTGTTLADFTPHFCFSLYRYHCLNCFSSHSSVFTCIGALGTPSRTGPLARKYLPGFPYSSSLRR